ncbi:MAG TPA: type II toxin-antitoxin system VapC family toxin [Acidobacteriaceae bacterium]
MLAVDTNVIVRYLARDDPRQTPQAEQVLRTREILVLKTVLIETEWVLRYSYGFGRDLIAAALQGLAGLPTIAFEDQSAVAQALEWFATGMDFADALHLASSASAGRFATFDRKLAASAKRRGTTNVMLLS